MREFISAILWITGLIWFFTSKDAKPARNYIGLAIIGSWILFIIIGLLCMMFLPNEGVDTSRINGW
jgi:amino acid transporter